MVTQKTTSKPSKPQKKLLKVAVKNLKQFEKRGGLRAPSEGPSATPTGSAQYIAPVDPLQTQGEEQVLAAASQGGGLDQASQNANNMLSFLAGDVLSPDSNPYLRQYGQYLAEDLGNQFATSVLPNIRTGTNAAGQFASSRHGIAEGLGAEGLSRQTGGALSDLYSKGYGQGLDAFTKGLALAPSVGQFALQPGYVTSAVGDVRQSRAQAPLSAMLNDYYMQQLSPLLTAQAAGGLSATIPGGSTVSTGPGPQSNGLLTGLGAASTGASLGASLAPLFGATGAGGAGAGAGLGALLAFL